MKTINHLHKISFTLLITLLLLSVHTQLSADKHANNTYITINNSNIKFMHVKNPAQKFAYAGKMHWHHRENRWDRVVVVYNGAPDPDKNHPVVRYVAQLPEPSSREKHQFNLHYKTFYLTANCDGNTPLSTPTKSATTSKHIVSPKTWRIDFDKHPLGRYTDAEVRADWRCPKWHRGNKEITVVGSDQAHSGKALRFNYPKGTFSCRKNKSCINWKPELGGEFYEISYSYWIKFPKGFDFVKGGKLPGVAGGTANSGGKKPNGSDGWSVRMMWNRNGKLIQYVYHPDQPRVFGEAMEWGMDKLELGKWHEIRTTVKINSPGKHNGVIQSWLNGKLVLERKDMRFRNTDKLLIDRFMFASFFGGSDASWAPPRDEHLFFDDLVITTP